MQEIASPLVIGSRQHAVAFLADDTAVSNDLTQIDTDAWGLSLDGSSIIEKPPTRKPFPACHRGRNLPFLVGHT
jgi:hypothetical protein